MARKSRKPQQIERRLGYGTAKEGNAAAPVVPAVYKTGLYARLSMYHETPDTIANQIRFLESYVAERPELEVVDIYVDYGRTGMNFQRPEFERMMEDIKLGKLQALVVKDFSRFGRNYIEAGLYIQKIFPFLGIRFIAINDQYDSLTGDADSLLVSMKNIINDYYSKELSVKHAASYDTKISMENYSWGTPPYGYLRSKDDPMGYDIDDEVAPYVKLIFLWAVQGQTESQIAANLTELGAPTPHRLTWMRSGGKAQRKGSDRWSPGSFRFILCNREYTGDYIRLKSNTRKCDPANNRIIPEDDWLVVPNHHQAYITQDKFFALQSAILSKREKNKARRAANKESFRMEGQEPFKGLLYCGLCGRKMLPIRDNWYGVSVNMAYRCTGVANERTQIGHPRFRINAAEMNRVLLWQVNLQIQYALDTKELLQRFSLEETASRLKAKRQGEINHLNGKLAAVRQQRTQTFERLADALIDQDTYRKKMDQLTAEAEALEEQIRQAKQRRKDVDTYFTADNEWLQRFTGITKVTEDDEDLIHELVKKVEVFPDDRLQVTFSYKDWMEPLVSMLEEASSL